MITEPKDWSLHHRDGGVALVPPWGPGAGGIRYEERLRPVRAVEELVAAYPVPEGFTIARTGAPRKLSTWEGEAAALVVVEGHLCGTPAELTFGFVLLDDFYARTVALAIDPARFDDFREAVESLCVADTHLLGRVRRRRFAYTPPRDWRATGALFETTWFPPDDRQAVITVCPALPALPGLGDALLARIAGGVERVRQLVVGPAAPVRARLAGQRWQLRGDEASGTHVVLLADDSFVYLVRLDTHVGAEAATLAVLDELVASIEPIPPAQAAQRAPYTDEALHHLTSFWNE